jgi:hypothetical protein
MLVWPAPSEVECLDSISLAVQANKKQPMCSTPVLLIHYIVVTRNFSTRIPR